MSEPTEFQRQFAESMAEIGTLVQRFADAIRPALIAAGKKIQGCGEALDESWPGWREFAANVGDYESEPPARACNCFCSVAHGGLGMCTGEAEPGLLRVVWLSGSRVDIPVCRACRDAVSAAVVS